MSTHRATSWVLLVAVLMALPSVSQAGKSPQTVIQEGAESVRGILKVKTKEKSPEEQAQKDKLKQVVDGFLDYRELAKRSLGPHWDARKPEEQGEFTQLLRDLIEASYTNAIRRNVDFQMKYDGEELAEDGASATVTAVASAKNSKGKTLSEDLVFHLFLKDTTWMIFDVEFGDVSLVRHYRGEFNRKIKKESYAALVTAMKKKLEEIRSGKIAEKDMKIK